MKIVDQVAKILEEEEELPELRETDLELEHAMGNFVDATIKVQTGLHQNLSCTVRLGTTRDHKFVYKVSAPTRDAVFSRRGNYILPTLGGEFVITEVEPRYQDKELKYYVMKVEQINA